jgi:HUS1 checkpoint protein
MRFFARLIGCALFLRLIQTLEKMGKQCLIHLTRDKVQFIMNSEAGEGVTVWSEITSTVLFDSYRVESMNNNEVGFEVSMDNLARCLKSCSVTSTSDVTMRLAKRGGFPVLSMNVELSGPNGQQLVQEIPVHLLSAAQLSAYSEPSVPDPEVYIMIPPLRDLRPVVDRMKNVDDRLIVTASMGGDFVLKVETEMVSIATYWSKLTHPQVEGRSQVPVDPSASARVVVDIKKFYRFLFSYQISPTNVVLCITHAALVVHVLLDDLWLTYYFSVLK